VLNILNEVSSYFGLPTIIISDRGTAFTSKQFEEYCKHNQIQHIKNAVRTPRANGQVERANKTILNYVRAMNDNPKDWDLTLHNLQWSVISQKNETSGFSPIDLVFNFNPIDVVQNHLTAAIHAGLGKDEKESVIDNRNQALVNIASERAKWKQRFNKKHANPSIYSTGNLVVVENEPAATGESRKLEPRYRGPYIVVKVLGNDRFVIEDIRGIQITGRKYCSVYSSDKIQPWCSNISELDVPDDDDDRTEDDPNAGLAELS